MMLPDDRVVNLLDLAVSHNGQGPRPRIEDGIARIRRPLSAIGAVSITRGAAVIVEAKESVGLVFFGGVGLIGVMKHRLGGKGRRHAGGVPDASPVGLAPVKSIRRYPKSPRLRVDVFGNTSRSSSRPSQQLVPAARVRIGGIDVNPGGDNGSKNGRRRDAGHHVRFFVRTECCQAQRFLCEMNAVGTFGVPHPHVRNGAALGPLRTGLAMQTGIPRPIHAVLPDDADFCRSLRVKVVPLPGGNHRLGSFACPSYILRDAVDVLKFFQIQKKNLVAGGSFE